MQRLCPAHSLKWLCTWSELYFTALSLWRCLILLVPQVLFLMSWFLCQFSLPHAFAAAESHLLHDLSFPSLRICEGIWLQSKGCVVEMAECLQGCRQLQCCVCNDWYSVFHAVFMSAAAVSVLKKFLRRVRHVVQFAGRVCKKWSSRSSSWGLMMVPDQWTCKRIVVFREICSSVCHALQLIASYVILGQIPILHIDCTLAISLIKDAFWGLC